MKKIVTLLLTLVLIVASLSACNTKKEEESASNQKPNIAVKDSKSSTDDSDINPDFNEQEQVQEDDSSLDFESSLDDNLVSVDDILLGDGVTLEDRIKNDNTKISDVKTDNSNDALDFSFSSDDFEISIDDIILADGVTLKDSNLKDTPIEKETSKETPIESSKIPSGLLPVGSVVLLKDSTKKVMIIGHNQIEVGNNEIIYDYSGCLFPEGYLNANSIYLFDNEQVEYVYHIGSENEKLQVNNLPSGLLPIGSVVLLKNSTKKVMIMGWCQHEAGNNEILYDYAGCIFPEGYLNANSTYLFDHTQIDTVHHLGYINEEQQELKETAEMLIAMWRSVD